MEGTVKQVAGRVGLPERTVRYYDRIDLVSPRRRSGAGYRLYGPEEEGKLRFVREAKSLGLSLEEIRTLIAAAERGCCGEVVPELDRLLAVKVAEIDARVAALVGFRDRLESFRRGHRAGCGCDDHSPFCGCLNGAAETEAAATKEEGVDMRSAHRELPLVAACGCGDSTSSQGCGCGCGGACGCGTANANAKKRTALQQG